MDGTEEKQEQIAIIEPPKGEFVDARFAAKALGISVPKFRTGYANQIRSEISVRGTRVFCKNDVMILAQQLILDKVERSKTVTKSISITKTTQFQEKYSPAQYTGEMAASAYDLLDSGMKPTDIVKELEIHPIALQRILESYNTLNAGLYISSRVKQAIFRWICANMTESTPKELDTDINLFDNLQRLRDELVTREDYVRHKLCKACVNRCDIHPKAAIFCERCAKIRFEYNEEKK